MKRIPWLKLSRRLRSLRTCHHTRKGERLAALSKAEQIRREIMCASISTKRGNNG